MRELESYRRAWLEFAQRAAGVVRGERLVTVAQLEDAHADHDTSRLPEAFADLPALQTATGQFYFVIDSSPIDSPDFPIG